MPQIPQSHGGGHVQSETTASQNYYVPIHSEEEQGVLRQEMEDHQEPTAMDVQRLTTGTSDLLSSLPRPTSPNPTPSTTASMGVAAEPAACETIYPRSLRVHLNILAEHRSLLPVLLKRQSVERAGVHKKRMDSDSFFNAEKDCCICAEALTAPESVVAKCGHVYHLRCIMRCPGIDQGQIACPICRKLVLVWELVTIRNAFPALKTSPRSNASEVLKANETGQNIDRENTSDGEAGARMMADGASASHQPSATMLRPNVCYKIEENGNSLDAQIVMTMHSTGRILDGILEVFDGYRSAMQCHLDELKKSIRLFQLRKIRWEMHEKLCEDFSQQEEMTMKRIADLRTAEQQCSKELEEGEQAYISQQVANENLQKKIDEREAQM